MSTDAAFALIEAERVRLADLADTLTPEQWDVPSLAEGWAVRDVLAHLTMPFSVGMPALLVGLVRNRGDFDRLADRWARERARSTPPTELAAALRANAAGRFTPPGLGPEAPLTDLVAHGLDIRVPLGLPTTDLDPALAVTLQFLTGRIARRFGVPAGSFDGRRLEATDLDWAHGTGPTERATAAELVAHLTRRRPLPEA